jgi:hypothetical protein
MRYFLLTLKHKWFVFLACRRTRASLWQALVHDWSKFTPAELPHYERQFFGDKSDPEGFARAWLHHQNRNPHHWEYWIPRTGHNRAGSSETARVCAHQPEVGPFQVFLGDRQLCECGDWNTPPAEAVVDQWWENAELLRRSLNASQPLPMPECYVREMVADWLGAGRAYTGTWDGLPEWLKGNAGKMILHPDTVACLRRVLIELGYEVPRGWRADAASLPKSEWVLVGSL